MSNTLFACPTREIGEFDQMNSYDVGIVGAGVVGCAIARELAHLPRSRLSESSYSKKTMAAEKKPAAATAACYIAASMNGHFR